MTISPKILSIIQKAGTAVFNADAVLREATADSAKKVSDAMTKNPFDSQHEVLYQHWKTVAGISQAMSTIEAELKKLYALAAAVPTHSAPTLALAAPGTAPLEVLNAIDVTDVVAKRSPRKPRGAKRRSAQDNTAKVLAQLQKVLNHQTFANLNQSSLATAIGLPKGSIGASIKKLIQDGKLVQGQGKEFKLAA